MFHRDKDKYFNIGKDETPEKVVALIDKKSQAFRHSLREQARDMERGAIAAFREGRPENVQAIFAASDDLWRNPYRVLLEVLEGSADIAQDFARALAQVPVDERPRTLASALAAAAFDDNQDTMLALVSFYEDLGATISPEHSDSALARAIARDFEFKDIKRICDLGANMDDAIVYMVRCGYAGSDTEKARLYKDRLEREAPPATAAADTSNDLLQQILATQQELTEKVDALAKAMEKLQPQEAPAAAETAAPEKPAALPRFKGF